MIIQHLNWLAVAVAAIAYFMLGAIWFNPNVFGKVWMKGHNISTPTEEDKKKMPMMMLMTLVMCFVATVCLAYLINAFSGYTVNWRWYSGVKIALVASAFACVGVGLNHMYTKKSMMTTIIDAGYHVAGLVAAGMILSVWH